MKKIMKIPLLCAALVFALGCFDEDEPFVPPVPRDPNTPYCDLDIIADTVLRPNHRTQEQLDADVMALYADYKTRYLKQSNNQKHYYAAATGTGANGAVALTISEAHGYAMIIFALAAEMNGAHGDEKQIFDGLNALRKVQKSTTQSNAMTNNLMSWVVFDVESDNPVAERRRCWINDISCWQPGLNDNGDHIDARLGRSSSATDGDLDNAYALLLAYKKWGDAQYLEDAKEIIESIKFLNMHDGLYRTKLGDWQYFSWSTGLPGSNPLASSRSSDWMPGHFRAFYRATGDNFWNIAADTVYKLLGQVSHPATGLMPDFVRRSPAEPDPTGGNVAGEHSHALYAFNACRVPWRLAIDWVGYRTPAAKTQINKISCWISNKTGQSPANIAQGYQLDGTVDRAGVAMAFRAPFTSGLVANSENQSFLNTMYDHIRESASGGSYNDALRLLNMFLVTGNWWAP